ncbi:hypothetical protein [Parabacteroides leei]|nr:hypothetical protein [Parabacteroides goldsteinii]
MNVDKEEHMEFGIDPDIEATIWHFYPISEPIASRKNKMSSEKLAN